MRKLETLLWYLKRPRLYPHFFGVISDRLLGSDSLQTDSSREAFEWCSASSIDTSTALKELTGSSASVSIENMFSEQFENSNRIAKECPVEMGGPGDLDLLYWSSEHLKALRVIETGVAHGWSSMAILLSVSKRNGARLISTDMPYPNRNNDSFVGCVVPAEIRTNWRILKYTDRQALPKALKALNTIDMCHYDSDKSYDGRMWAYPMLWAALRPGGFFISDDIGDNVAFRDFSKTIVAEPIVIEKEGKFIGVMIKPEVDQEAA